MKCLVIGMIACMEIIIFRRVFLNRLLFSLDTRLALSLLTPSVHIVLAAYNVFSCLCQLIFLKYVLEWSSTGVF